LRIAVADAVGLEGQGFASCQISLSSASPIKNPLDQFTESSPNLHLVGHYQFCVAEHSKLLLRSHNWLAVPD